MFNHQNTCSFQTKTYMRYFEIMCRLVSRESRILQWKLQYRVIFGPPVTTESRGRFESGFGYFEVLKKNWAPMPLAKVWAKPRRGQNPKWPPAAILDLLKSAILRRFYSNNTTEVSFLTNYEVRNPFQGLFFQILAIFTLKSKMAAILPVIYAKISSLC